MKIPHSSNTHFLIRSEKLPKNINFTNSEQRTAKSHRYRWFRGRLLLLLFLMVGAMPNNMHGQIIDSNASKGECGAYVHTSPPNIPTEDKKVGDRFGNIYAPSELYQTTSNLAGCDCNDLTPSISTNYFQLYFTECLAISGEGFDVNTLNTATGNTWGDDYKRVLCQVFHDLSTLITPYDVNAKVKIRINQITSADGIPDNVNGTASSYYDNRENGGILYSRAWKAINSGQPILPDDYYHGYMKIDFPETAINIYNINIGSLPAANEYDLYTLVYHEALHLLGFAALMDGDGTSLFSNGISFNRFVTALSLDNGNSVIINQAPLPSPVWTLNTPTVTINDLHNSCLDSGSDLTGPDMVWTHSATQLYPVFTGNSQVGGSSFSHFESECDGDFADYVMQPSLGLGEHPVIHEHEKQVLCDLGYTLNDPNFACDNTPCAVVGNFDVLLNNDTGLAYEYCPDEDNFFIIDIADVNGILANDINADDVALMLPAVGVNNVTVVDQGNGKYKVSYLVPGVYALWYIPISNDANCTVQGSGTYVSFQVTSCLSQCVDANGVAPDCTDYNNTCNLVCNPEFCGELLEPLGSQGFQEFFNVDAPGWAIAFDTPNWHFDDITNESWLGILYRTPLGAAHSQESVYSLSSIGTGKYLYAAYHRLTNGGLEDVDENDLKIALITNDLLTEIQSVELTSFGPNTNNDVVITASNYVEFITVSSPESSTFIRSGGSAEIPSGFISDAIWVFPKAIAATEDYGFKIHFDQLEIVKDDFKASVDDESIFCGESAVLGGDEFCMISDVDIKYYWTTAAAPTQHLLDYFVRINSNGETTISIDGNIVSTIPSLVVSPEASTCYRLYREAIIDGTTELAELNFDNNYEEICVNVIGFIYDASFEVENCTDLTLTVVPYDDTNVQTWDFGDGSPLVTTFNGENYTYTYSTQGTFIITHTVGENCASTYQISFTMPNCEEACPPLATFDVQTVCNIISFQSNDPLGDHQWDFGNGTTSTEVNPTVTYNSGTYLVVHTLVNDCGSVSVHSLTVTTQDCGENLSCEICTVQNIIGVDNETHFLAEYTSINIDDNDNIDDDNTFQKICVKGTIRVNNNYNFSNCKFLMHPGATLIIENGNLLDIKDSQLLGCDQMWRGIEIEKGGRLYMQDNLIADAQYAVYARPDEVLLTEVTLRDNIFKNNFVGLYIPNKGKLKHAVSENKFINESVLKTPFTGQTALPENLPEQNERSLAGIFFRKISDGFSLTNNTFINLTSGALGHFTNFTAYGNSFLNIQDAAELYPNFAGNRGVSLSSAGVGNTTLLAQNNYFANCSIGIKADHAKLTATGNTLIDTREGIGAIMANAGGVTIGGAGDDKNTITNAFVGIFVWNADPTGQVSITNNTIMSNNAIGGAGLWMLFNDAPSFISENVIDVNGTGTGIQLSSVNNHTLDQNTINLNNAVLNKSGIRLEDVGNSLLSYNTITGVDVTGDNNIGISVNSSPDNVYCCNTVNNTRIGVQFDGGCISENNFRGTTFGDHEIGLDITANGNVGSQKHSENRWIGTYTNGATWDVPPVAAQDFPFEVDINGASLLPPNAMPNGWFLPAINPDSGQDVCLPENCAIDEFAPESPDTKKIAAGEITTVDYTESIQWLLSRHLYRKLSGVIPQDPAIASFKTNNEFSSIGKFYGIDEGIRVMYEGNGNDISIIQSNLEQITDLLAQLTAVDIQITTALASEIDGLLAQKTVLATQIQGLVTSNQTLGSNIQAAREGNAALLKVENNSVGVLAIYEQNTKIVNDIFLAKIAIRQTGFTTAQVSDLESVAIQCPLEGGSAVYEARSILLLLQSDRNFIDDCNKNKNLSLESAEGQENEMITPVNKFVIFPNPVKEVLTIKWKNTDFVTGGIRILDMFGRTLLSRQLETGISTHTLDVSTLENGLYFIQLSLDNAPIETKKFIISN